MVSVWFWDGLEIVGWRDGLGVVGKWWGVVWDWFAFLGHEDSDSNLTLVGCLTRFSDFDGFRIGQTKRPIAGRPELVTFQKALKRFYKDLTGSLWVPMGSWGVPGGFLRVPKGSWGCLGGFL